MSHRGDIQQTHAEILRLIAKVKGSAHSRPRPLRSVPTPHAHAPSNGRRGKVARRSPAPNEIGDARSAGGVSPQLAELAARQDRVERALLNTDTTAALESFDKRLERIEKLLVDERAQNSVTPAAPATTEPDTDYLFAGKLDIGLLPDMLQLVSSNQLTGVFVVAHGDFEVKLYFDGGDICHAVGPNVEGESAFFVIMSLEEGRYSFHEVDELPSERTVHSKTQFLILEGLRKLDEERAGADHETG